MVEAAWNLDLRLCHLIRQLSFFASPAQGTAHSQGAPPQSATVFGLCEGLPDRAMNFGDRGEMIAPVKEHLGKLETNHPEAQLLDPDLMRVIFLMVFDPRKYHMSAIAGANPGITRKAALCRMLKPAKRILRTMRRA